MNKFESEFAINEKVFVVYENQIHKAIIKNIIFIEDGVEYKVQIDNKHIFEAIFLHLSSFAVAKSIFELDRRWEKEETRKQFQGVRVEVPQNKLLSKVNE